MLPPHGRWCRGFAGTHANNSKHGISRRKPITEHRQPLAVIPPLQSGLNAVRQPDLEQTSGLTARTVVDPVLGQVQIGSNDLGFLFQIHWKGVWGDQPCFVPERDHIDIPRGQPRHQPAHDQDRTAADHQLDRGRDPVAPIYRPGRSGPARFSGRPIHSLSPGCPLK